MFKSPSRHQIFPDCSSSDKVIADRGECDTKQNVTECAKAAVPLDMGPLEETMPEVAPKSSSSAAVNRKRPSNEAVSEASSRRRPSVAAAASGDTTTAAAAAASGQQSAPCPTSASLPRCSSHPAPVTVRNGVLALLLLLLLAAFVHVALCWLSSLKANLFEILYILGLQLVPKVL